MTDYVIRHGRKIAVETVETNVKPTPRRQAEPFAKVPLEWAVKAAKATRTPQALVWVLLLRLAWQAKDKPFPFSNAALARCGVNREAKRRTLAALEAAGLVKVERQHGRSPIVTLVRQRRLAMPTVSSS
jgi:hypothetical protein